MGAYSGLLPGSLGLPVLAALLIDRSRRALLCFIGTDAAILVRVLDVLVLALALLAAAGWHCCSSSGECGLVGCCIQRADGRAGAWLAPVASANATNVPRIERNPDPMSTVTK